MDFLETLGTTDISQLVTSHPSVLLYGDPGTGKSTLVSRLYPARINRPPILYVVSSVDVIRPMASWIAENAEMYLDQGLRTLFAPNPAWAPSKSKTHPFLDGTNGTTAKQRAVTEGGIPVRLIGSNNRNIASDGGSTRKFVLATQAIGNELLSANGQEPAIAGAVWDELSVWMRRIQREIFEASPDIFDIPLLFPELEELSAVDRAKQIKDLTRFLRTKSFGLPYLKMLTLMNWWSTVPQRTGAFFCSVNQRSPAKFYTADDPEVKKKRTAAVGDVKAMEGPEAATEAIRRVLCANASIVLCGRIVNGERMWVTEASESRHAKFRSFGIPERVTADEVAWAFYKAGYDVPRPTGDVPSWYESASVSPIETQYTIDNIDLAETPSEGPSEG